MTISQQDQALIDAYLADCALRDLSEETRKVRGYYLRKFGREVGFHAENVQELRQRLREWLMRPSIQPQTRALWLTLIHGAYAFWNREGYFKRVVAANGALEDFDPTLGLQKPKTKKGRPHPIPETDLSAALAAADPRMRCWLLLGAACGLRCKEIALLERQDVKDNLRNPVLTLRLTKGNKERTVPLPPDVLAELRAYGLPAEGRLWDVTPEAVSRRGNEHLHKHGITSTMHSLRHRFGTQFYRATNDPFLTADVMGHSSQEISRTYAAPDQSKASAAFEALRVA